MIYTLALILCLAGSGFTSHSANNYIESVLRAPFYNSLRGLALDPAQINNFTTEFQDKVAIIGTVKGKAQYYNGSLFGIVSTSRYTECQGPSFSFGTGRINCTLAFNNLNTYHDGDVKYGKLPKFTVKAKANVTRTLVFVDVMQHPGQAAQVSNFHVQEMGKVSAKFTGLGSPLNKFLKVLEDGYNKTVAMEITMLLHGRVQFAFNSAVSQVPMPLH